MTIVDGHMAKGTELSRFKKNEIPIQPVPGIDPGTSHLSLSVRQLRLGGRQSDDDK